MRVKKKSFTTCGDCPEMESYENVGSVHKSDPEAKARLKAGQVKTVIETQRLLREMTEDALVNKLMYIYTEKAAAQRKQSIINRSLRTAMSLVLTMLHSHLGRLKLSFRACSIPYAESVGMLITYYAVAVMTQGVYGTNFIIGWTLFALCSPILAVLTWKSKEKGVFSGVIRIGIVAVSVLSSILLFDRLKIYDLVIDGILIYFLFFKKVQRH